jgi:polyisoprenyl-phosphate glycosyltransferase
MPVYQDWDCAALVCKALDESLKNVDSAKIQILLVDDGSSPGFQGWQPFVPCHAERIDALCLRRNLGHQRAIAAGLCHVHDHVACDAVVVMDADGEDRPEDVTALLRHVAAHPEGIVFAERRRRFENFVFQGGYSLYRALHLLLTGVAVRVGNFSAIPFHCLKRLVWMSELWNHYAGAVFRSRLPYFQIPLDRGRRFRGSSRMNLIDLVIHGLSGIATFYDSVATRILIANVVAAAFVVAGTVAVVAIRLGTNAAIPGWATYTLAILLVLLVLVAAISINLLFSLITNRTAMPVIPARDYGVFVDRVECLWTRAS